MRKSLINYEKFAFIGLGQMGSRMAQNLAAGPCTSQLFLFDSDPHNLAQTADACSRKLLKLQDVDINTKSITRATSVIAAVQDAEVIITMLPNGDVVRKVYSEILALDLKEKCFLDCSTVNYDIPMWIANHDSLVRQKHIYMDCPVSGGVGGAEAGSLTFMIGGENFSKAKKYLESMGSKFFSCGEVGTGIVSKLANNLILAQSMIAVAEGMTLGTKMGVHAKTLSEIIGKSSGQCWSNDTYNPYPGVLPNVPSSKDYKGGFASALMLKDIRLALEAAASLNIQTPGANNSCMVYNEIVEKGNGNKDFSCVLEHVHKK